MLTTSEPHLPHDILEEIAKQVSISYVVDNEQDDHGRLKTLTSLALVSCDMARTCKPYIFERVYCGVRGLLRRRSIRLAEALRDAPNNGTLIRWLTFDYSVVGDNNVRDRDVLSMDEMSEVHFQLMCLGNITHLSLLCNILADDYNTLESSSSIFGDLIEAALLSPSFQSLSLDKVPEEPPVGVILASLTLRSLQINEPPPQWDGLDLVYDSNITHLRIGDNFDLSILDRCPFLEDLEISEPYMLTMPTDDTVVLPPFKLKRLVMESRYPAFGQRPLETLGQYFMSRGRIKSVQPFQHLNELRVPLGTDEQIKPLRDILELTSSLSSLTIEAPNYLQPYLSLSALQLSNLIRQTLKSLTHLKLVLPSRTFPEPYISLIKELEEFFGSIRFANVLKSISLELHFHILPFLPSYRDLRMMASVMASPRGYPVLEEVNMSVTAYPDGLWDIRKEYEGKHAELQKYVAEGMKEVRDRKGVRFRGEVIAGPSPL